MAEQNQNHKHVAIIGAGIVGVSTAIWLQRAGHRVTIIDPKGPASGTSYGNAGVLAAGSIVPVPVPGLLLKAPKMLLDNNFPLFLRWSYLPRLIPFLPKYLANGTTQRVERIAAQLATLLGDTASQHVSLAKGTGAEHFITEGDYVFGYADRTAYEDDHFTWGMRRRHGFTFEEMNAEQFASYDPAMNGLFGFGVRMPDHGHISDPGAYVKALAAHVVENDGTLLEAKATDIIISNGRATGVETSAGPVDADEIVIASGMWSGPLAKKLAINVPMEAERGYHIEFVNPSIMPKSPVMVASGKFVMTPMNGRLRCAGIVEFGGMSEKHSRAPIELLKKQTAALLPGLTYDRIDEWMGFRPSTSDSLPLIGVTKCANNVWTGFGHQHIGLTAGPKTGRWLAQLINKEKPNVDLSAFSPLRFTP